MRSAPLPSRSTVVSSMIPIEAETGRRSSSSVARHDAGVQVGQKARLFENEPRAALDVLDRRLAAELAQLLLGDLVPKLGLVPEREERLTAPRCGAGASDCQHLVHAHESPLPAPRRTREGAVAAHIAAERGQRNEDLRRVRDERPASQPASLGEQFFEWSGEKVGGGGHVLREHTSMRRPRIRLTHGATKGDEMKFLFLIHGDADGEAALTPDERRSIVGEHIAYASDAARAQRVCAR